MKTIKECDECLENKPIVIDLTEYVILGSSAKRWRNFYGPEDYQQEYPEVQLEPEE